MLVVCIHLLSRIKIYKNYISHLFFNSTLTACTMFKVLLYLSLLFLGSVCYSKVNKI